MKPLEQIFGATTTKPSLDDIFKGKLNAIKKKQEKEGFWSGVKSDITDRSEKLGEIADAYGSGEQGKAESAFQTAGQAIGGLWDVAGRGISAITPDFIEKPITEGLGKLAQTAPVRSLVQGWENIKENNPRLARNLEASGAVASVLPVEKAVMTGIKGATKGAEKGAEIIGRTGKKISTATGEAATFATSKLTGLNPSTIKTILSAPKALSAAEKAGLDRVTLGGRVKSALDDRIDALSDRGKAYTAIRESGATVDIDESVFKGLLDKYRIKTDGAKVIIDKESLPLKQTEVNDLERFMDMFGNEKSLSANAFMNARSALADMAKYGTDKSSAFISLVREMRHELNKNRVKIPGLKEIDEFFASEKSTLKQLRKDYINPATGELKDNALSKIANLTGAGKDKVLNRLEKLVPGIREEINILKALEDIESSKGIKVGTYTSAGISGAIALSGNILGALLSLILSSPGVAVPIIKAFGIAKGVSKQTIDNIINKMKTGGKMTADQIEIIDQAVRDYSAKIEDNIKKAQPGLSLKDVSKDIQLKTKQEQLEIIKKTNPAPNEYNTWIRSVDDIKSPKEAFIDDGENFAYPDFTPEMGRKALESGKIKVYSSYDIKNGNFVTTSKMSATDYAGGGKVYEKEVDINDVAWINADEGQFAKTTKANKSAIIDDIDTGLLQEAKKYKSAEEWSKKILTGDDDVDINKIGTKRGEPVLIKSYHGTNENFDKFIIPEKGVRYSGDGVYFAPRKSRAESFGENVKEVYLDLKNPYIKYIPEGQSDMQFNELAREVKEKGYDSIIVRFTDTDTETGELMSDWINEVVVFDTNRIKTKSQLEDIWKKANSGQSLK